MRWDCCQRSIWDIDFKGFGSGEGKIKFGKRWVYRSGEKIVLDLFILWFDISKMFLGCLWKGLGKICWYYSLGYIWLGYL